MPPGTPVKRRFSETSKDCPAVKIVEMTGEGSFYKIYRTETGTALRIAKKRGDGHEEASILAGLSPEYVNKMLRYWIEDGYMHFEMEYCPMGNLEDWLVRNRYLRPTTKPKRISEIEQAKPVPKKESRVDQPEPTERFCGEALEDPFAENASFVDTSDLLCTEESEASEVPFEPTHIRHPKWRVDLMRQVSAALAHIHDKNIIHMDVKPANILINSGRFVLCDFNIAKVGEGLIDLDGDPVYMAPEILKNKCYFVSDVYSLGIIYLSLCNAQKRLPTSGEEYSALRKNNFHGWKLDLIGRRMLEQNPKQRCIAQDVLAHFNKLVK